MAIEHFDAVIVGTGFGGSVMAHRLAEAGKKICVLERGKAYPPGSFPRSPIAFKNNFWDPSQGLHGLFNVWSFRFIDALVSSALGGGSHIYANVLLRKDPEWFYDIGPDGKHQKWPISRETLEPHYDQVEKIIRPVPYPMGHKPYSQTAKTVEFHAAAKRAGLQVFDPPIAVTFANSGRPPVPGEYIVGSEGDNLHGAQRFTCRLCGECDIGCNFGSKNTLDFNYLSMAKRNGADIRTRCEVRSFKPREGAKGYSIRYVEHLEANEGRETDTDKLPQVELTADTLILSAGALGTTYLFLKNRAAFSKVVNLGKRFCGNGDLLTFAMRCKKEENGKSTPRLIDASVGPVITTTVRVPDFADGGVGAGGRKVSGHYIQNAGFPNFLSWVVQAVDAPSALGQYLRLAWRYASGALGLNIDTDLGSELSQYLIGESALSGSSLPLLGMGKDTPDGELALRGEKNRLDVKWKMTKSGPYFDAVKETSQKMAEAMGGTFKVNPTLLFKRLITVHPLGGCPMGHSPEDGFADTFGQVHNYENLYVADGSVLPGPVGPNPSLTIAALSNRTADKILGVKVD